MASLSASSAVYDDWTREDLVKRIVQLESKLANLPAESPKPQQKPLQKEFDFSAYPKRKIALKFCYSGWEYNGLAYQPSPTPLPTVEGVLFDALVKARLVDSKAGFEGCGWEKCGRTDRGVSAGGQVVSLWVRSALGELESKSQLQPPSSSVTSDADLQSAADDEPPSPPARKAKSKPREPHQPEHNYVAILNRVLPLTIRILAWSPVSSKFSARFSCRYRHYRYFFSPQGLDIDLMRAAASRLVGEHDFRNLCKLDPAKQITIFRRKIISATIEPVDANNPDIYVLNLIGTAFLYHQVRHIMAILFYVGAGLERPSVITSLLNVVEGAEQAVEETDLPLQVVNGRPEYQMADALPLMLWDCGYRPEEVDWRIDGYTDEQKRREKVTGELCHVLQATYDRSKIFSALNGHFFAAAAYHHPRPVQVFPLSQPPSSTEVAKQPVQIPLGGGTFKRTTRYTPLLDRVRMDSVEIVNERWRRRGERRRAEAEAPDEDE